MRLSVKDGGTRDGDARDFVVRAAAFVEDSCLVWPFSLHWKGYGQVNFAGKVQRAHRLVCKLAHGEPKFLGAEAAHSCGNRACVNPRHLRWASRKENAEEMVRHGNATTKLSKAAVLEIRSSDAVALQKLADKFGVTKQCVWAVKHRKVWTHL